MKVVSYRQNGSDRAGVATDGGLLDAAALLGADAIGVRELLAADRLGELAGAAADPPAGAAVGGDPEPRPPVPDPEKIVCIGLNYRSHAAEAGIDPPEVPAIFGKFRNALRPAGTEVKLPEASEKVDNEAEVAFVVGRRCSRVDVGEAEAAIAGFTLLNDLSARDLQFATPQWMPGKVFDGSAPCGPALVTPDEAGAHDEIEFKLELNGVTMQDASTADLVFSMPELLSKLSEWMTMEPGDIVSTGTPSGVGSVREPRVWLKPGDEIAISSPTLGRLETRIA
jgi:2-keto-4-pentenoate hydratase/2-oxohepta-3-ene-1,7-dioic acid hydratase in catechol pathway